MNTIFCFSGTGNSLYVAKRIGAGIDAQALPMDLTVSSTDSDVVGFVFPAYFWSMPHRVAAFLSQLEIANPNAYLFAVITYGGVIHGISGEVNQILQKKGRSLRYAANMKCVENYLPGYKVNDRASTHQRVDRQCDAIAEDLSARKEKTAQTPILNGFIKKFFPWEEGACDQHFSLSPACTSCGLCARVCPVQNISLADGKPAFHHRCEHCLACVHMCPEKAIDWKEKTVGKERYRNPHIPLGEWIAFWERSSEGK